MNPWMEKKQLPLSRNELLLIRKVMVKAIHPDIWRHEAAAVALAQLNEAINKASKAVHSFVIVRGSLVKWKGHWWEVLSNTYGSRVKVRLFSKLWNAKRKLLEYQASAHRSEIEDCRVAVNGVFNFVLKKHPFGCFQGNVHNRYKGGEFVSDNKTVHTAKRSPGYCQEEIVNYLLDNGKLPGVNVAWRENGQRVYRRKLEEVNGEAK